MIEKYYCSVRDENLSVNEVRRCEFYDSGYCNSQEDDCDVEDECSGLEQSVETLQPGDWITADTTAQSLRNLRMLD